jgi:hypothetical protein
MNNVRLHSCNSVDAQEDRLLAVSDLTQAKNLVFLVENVDRRNQDENEYIVADCTVFVNKNVVDLAHLIALEAHVVTLTEDTPAQVPRQAAVSDLGGGWWGERGEKWCIRLTARLSRLCAGLADSPVRKGELIGVLQCASTEPIDFIHTVLLNICPA